MKKGLDEAGRDHIRKMVADQISGERVREAIRNRVRSTDYDYGKNVDLLDWLRRRAYKDTADYLVRFLEDRN